ncbi:outer membrane protein assembly factor BamC [Escherichia coli]
MFRLFYYSLPVVLTHAISVRVSGDEAYPEAAPLAELHAPAGMILPVTSGDYAIPVTNGSGAVGKALDIRPPAQPLALVSGARTQFTGDTASLLVENGRGNTLWPQVVSVLQAKKTTPSPNVMMLVETLTTDWVQWNRLDEDEQYRGRYQISVKPQGYQQAVTVKLLNLEQAGKTGCRRGFHAALQHGDDERYFRRSG